MSDDPQTTMIERRARRRRLWRRITLRSVVGAGLVVVLILVVLNRTNALGRAVLPQVSAMFNCDATAGRVSLGGDGKIVVRDLRLRIPGIDGLAGQFLSAPRVKLSPRWISLLTGSPSVRRLEMFSPHIRLSQDADFELNIALLQAGSGGGGLVPEISLNDGVVEFGEHDGASYRKLTEIRVEGDLTRVSLSSARYAFELRELEGAPGVGSEFEMLSVVGDLDLKAMTGQVTLGNLDLRRLSRTKVPSSLQDLWERMSMDGAVKETVFSYDPSRGMSATFDLHDVDLNIPIPADRDTDDPDADPDPEDSERNEWVAMRGVSGKVSFSPAGLEGDLTGSIEDLQCRVNLRTDGLDLDAGLRCEIEAPEFIVSEQPQLLPFAPWFVRRIFQRFSGPTAVVKGIVVVERDRPATAGATAEIRVAGELTFVQGNAQFESFTYPFQDMRGRITFDDEAIRIERISGIGPTGAKLLAEGFIAPPQPGAAVELNITVVDTPYDQHLLDALPPSRRKLVEAVFSAEAHQELRLAGLLEHEDDRVRRRSRLDDLELQLRRARSRGQSKERIESIEIELARLRALDERRRSFDVGGTLDRVEIHILRDEGMESEYRTEIDVVIAQAGILASVFPYPAYASDLTITIRDERVEVAAPHIRGLSGATGSIDARIQFSGEASETPTEYDLELNAEGLSADEFLLSALPSQGDDSAFEPRRIIDSLGLEGLASCSARALRRDDGSLGYEVALSFEDMSSHLKTGELHLEHLSGAIVVTDRDASLRDVSGSIGNGTFEADISATMDGVLGGGMPRDVTGSIRVRDFELSEPIEDLVGVVAPQLADIISARRYEHAPSGVLDAECELTLKPQSQLEYELRITNPRDLAANALGGRIALDDCTGAIQLTPERIALERFGTTIRFDQTDAGRLTLNGDWPLGAARETSEGQLDLSFQSARFESPVVRRVLGIVDPALERSLESAQVRGRFSASGSARQSAGGSPELRGELRPASLTFRRNQQDIRFPRMDGRITLEGDHGQLDQLIAMAPNWTFETSGRWSMRDSLAIDTTFALHASSLSPDLVSLLPEAGREAFESVALEIDGPLIIRNGSLIYELGEMGRVAKLEVTSEAQFGPTRLTAVVPIEMSAGTATIDAGINAKEGAAHLDTVIRAEQFTAAGIAMETGDLHLMMGNDPGVFTVPLFTAQTHGGEISAQAVIRPGRGDPNDARAPRGSEYELDLRASGVDFATFLRSLRASGSEDTDPNSEPLPTIGSRGELDAILQLAGDTSDGASRRGRGTIRIQNGEVLELPGIMGLLRLSNLQPPIGETLEYASAEFFVRGTELTFDHLEASSASVVIAGFGTMSWPTMEIDLRFNTRGNRGVPILSELLRGVRNELITTHVTGTLRDPAYSLEQLPATRRMLSTIFRGQPRNTSPPKAIEPASDNSNSDNEGD